MTSATMGKDSLELVQDMMTATGWEATLRVDDAERIRILLLKYGKITLNQWGESCALKARSNSEFQRRICVH